MLVSVIIPCFNVSDCVQNAVESAMNLSYAFKEVICIDNNSTDSTWGILLKMRDKYPSLILDKELKPGAPAARNRGLAHAKGKWIQFLDADDVLDANKIAHQIDLIKSSAIEPSFVAAAFKRKNLNGSVKVEEVIENEFVSPFLNRSGITSSNLWLAETLSKTGGWNEQLTSSQETDLMLRLVLMGGKCIFDHSPLTTIRERRKGQISKSDPVRRWKHYLDVRIAYLKNLEVDFNKEFRQNYTVFYSYLLSTMVILGKYNDKEALYYYRKFLMNESNIVYRWKPTDGFGITKLGAWIIRIFGLRVYLTLGKLSK